MDKVKLTGLGGLLAGVLGSVCCVGPAVLAGLGFGVSAISFARDFGFLHLPMMVLAFLMLGTAFYLGLRKKVCAAKENSVACGEALGKRSRNILFLGIVTALTLILLIYPSLR